MNRMPTPDLENVDFYLDEDFAVIYLDPKERPQEEDSDDEVILEVAKELILENTPPTPTQKSLKGRVERLSEEKILCNEEHDKYTDSSPPIQLSFQPPETVNSMELESISVIKKFPEALLENTIEKKEERAKNCCGFFRVWFFKKKVRSSTKSY